MTDPTPRRLSIAVWAAWNHPANMASEGMGRLLGFLIEGAAASGRVRFHVCVCPVNLSRARAMLEGLRAREGDDWALHAIEAPDNDLTDVVAMPSAAPTLLAHTDAAVGRCLFLLGLLAAPFLALRALLRPIWRQLWNQGGLRLAVATLRDPVGNAPAVAVALRGLRLRLFRRFAAALEAWAAVRRHQLVSRPSPPDGPAPAVAESAPAPEPPMRVPSLPPEDVDAWLSLMADLVVPAAIPGRRAMIFPDALMLDFGGGWNPESLRPGGAMHEWFRLVRQNLGESEAVITFSRHVAQRHAVERLGADAAKMRVIPHAPPDSLPLLDFVPPTRRRDPRTRSEAAELLRRHSALRGWDYLADFPFEDVCYIAVSTQERPSKNLPLLLEAFRILVHERFADVKLLMTTELVDDPETPFRRLHRLIADQALALDAVSLPRIPAAEHAALYHGAAIAVHPSFFEGGDAPFPFSESVSVGTPCLMARGPHTEELLEQHPELAPFVFDPYDAEGLANLIQDAIARRDEILFVQQAVYARMGERRWAQVAEEYAAAATGIPLPPVRRPSTLAG